MKTKGFDKKLVLTKKTIAHLDEEQMHVLHGKSGQPQCALTDDDKTCPITVCTFTDIGNTCPITACLSGVWC